MRGPYPGELRRRLSAIGFALHQRYDAALRDRTPGAGSKRKLRVLDGAPDLHGADQSGLVDCRPSARNNRIIIADFLNRSCAFDARLESILRAAPAQILSTASARIGRTSLLQNLLIEIRFSAACRCNRGAA